MKKTVTTLADGRELMYFGAIPEHPADYPDRRQLTPAAVQSQARRDPLLGEWVIIASHRQDRTFQPATDQCPLDPSTPESLTEIPAPDYEVVVFENRFPTLGAQPAASDTVSGSVLVGRPAIGRCEVVCFSPCHDASLDRKSVV